MAAKAMTIPHADVETFLGLFASTPAALAQELQQCPQPWQMRPLQARPLLRLGDDVVLLDEQYLMEWVTRACTGWCTGVRQDGDPMPGLA
jgi:hypothetical protein